MTTVLRLGDGRPITVWACGLSSRGGAAGAPDSLALLVRRGRFGGNTPSSGTGTAAS